MRPVVSPRHDPVVAPVILGFQRRGAILVPREPLRPDLADLLQLRLRERRLLLVAHPLVPRRRVGVRDVVVHDGQPEPEPAVDEIDGRDPRRRVPLLILDRADQVSVRHREEPRRRRLDVFETHAPSVEGWEQVTHEGDVDARLDPRRAEWNDDVGEGDRLWLDRLEGADVVSEARVDTRPLARDVELVDDVARQVPLSSDPLAVGADLKNLAAKLLTDGALRRRDPVLREAIGDPLG